MGRNNVFLSKVSEKYNRQKFIEWLFEEEKAEETVASYVLTMDMFFEAESEFSKYAIIRFKQRLMKRVSPTTVNMRLCGIKAYADWMGIHISIKLKVNCPREVFFSSLDECQEFCNYLNRKNGELEYKYNKSGTLFTKASGK